MTVLLRAGYTSNIYGVLLWTRIFEFFEYIHFHSVAYKSKNSFVSHYHKYL